MTTSSIAVLHAGSLTSLILNGIGRTGEVESILEYTQVKTVVINVGDDQARRSPSLGVKSDRAR